MILIDIPTLRWECLIMERKPDECNRHSQTTLGMSNNNNNSSKKKPDNNKVPFDRKSKGTTRVDSHSSNDYDTFRHSAPFD